MTDALRKELPRMLEEHKRIRAATEKSWRAHRSAGPNQLAIAHSGEDAVRGVYAKVDRSHTRPDGTIRYENVFLWAAGKRM